MSDKAFRLEMAIVCALILVFVGIAATPVWKSLSYDSANGNVVPTFINLTRGAQMYGTNLAVDTDARFSDARTPTSHKTSHRTGGTDAMTAADIGADTAGTAAGLVANKLDTDSIVSSPTVTMTYAADSLRADVIGGGGGGTVTSVTATSPLSSTGGADPVISMAADSVAQLSNAYANWARIDRCGWVTQPSIQFDADTRTVTLTGTGTYHQTGVFKTASLPASVQIAADTGVYYVFMDGNLTPDSSTSAWTLLDAKIPVCAVTYHPARNPSYLFQSETHTSLIDRRLHWYEHTTAGTRHTAGGTLSQYSVAPSTASATDSDNRFAISAAQIADEDLIHSLDALAKPTGGSDYLLFYRDSTAGSWKWEKSTVPYKARTRIEYDDGDGTTAASGTYINTYLAYTNIQGQGRHIIILGQAGHTTASAAYAETAANLSLSGFPVAEIVVAWQLTWVYSAAYSTTGKCALNRAPQRVDTSVTAVNNPSQTASHNSLSGLQGGNGSDYYHVGADSASGWDSHVAATTTAHGGIVPSSRTVNGQALSSNITLPLGLAADSIHAGANVTLLTASDSVTISSTASGSGYGCETNPTSLTASDTGRIVAAYYTAAATDTAFSADTGTSQHGFDNYSLRVLIPAASVTKSGSQFRLIVKSGDATLNVDNVSIGIQSSTSTSTTTTPTEVIFSTNAAHGFSLAANRTLRSDWTSYTITAGTNYLITFDASGSGTDFGKNTSATGAKVSYYPNSNCYNTATFAYADWQYTDTLMGVFGIEVQSDVSQKYWLSNTKTTDFASSSDLAAKVAGASASVDSEFMVFSGTTGKTVKQSGVFASTFAAASHTQAQSTITGLTTSDSPIFAGLRSPTAGIALDSQVVITGTALTDTPFAASGDNSSRPVLIAKSSDGTPVMEIRAPKTTMSALVGRGAGQHAYGGYNTAVGTWSLYAATSGGHNTAIGYDALLSLTASHDATAVGHEALGSATYAERTVALGSDAGRYAGVNHAKTTALTSVDSSVYIGTNAHASASTGVTNEIAIGANSVGKGSNTAVLGNLSTNATYLYGDLCVDSPLAASSPALYVDSENDRVGIGTAAPTTKLTISSENSAIWNATNDNFSVSVTNTQGGLSKTFVTVRDAQADEDVTFEVLTSVTTYSTTLRIKYVLRDGVMQSGTTGLALSNGDTIGFTIASNALKLNADSLTQRSRYVSAYAISFK